MRVQDKTVRIKSKAVAVRFPADWDERKRASFTKRHNLSNINPIQCQGNNDGSTTCSCKGAGHDLDDAPFVDMDGARVYLENAGERYNFTSDVVKVDAEARIVYGWVSVADIIDLQGDIIPQDEMTKMMTRFMDDLNMNRATIDGNHNIEEINGRKSVGHIIESVPEFRADKLRWWVAVKIDDGIVWDIGIRDGFHGFSIGGSVEEIEFDESLDAWILREIKLDEFSVLYGFWPDSNIPVHPANQESVAFAVKAGMDFGKYTKTEKPSSDPLAVAIKKALVANTIGINNKQKTTI